MTDPAVVLREAQERRRVRAGLATPPPERIEMSDEERRVSAAIDYAVGIYCDTRPGTNADQVSPKAKKKLHGLLRYYANKPHPFEACVRDNRKRFGPRAEAVCAVLKDIIRGTTKWRGKHNPRDRGRTAWAMSEEEVQAGAPEYDNEVADVLLALNEEQRDELCRLLVTDVPD